MSNIYLSILFVVKYHHKNVVKAYFGFEHHFDSNTLFYYLGMEYLPRNLNEIIMEKIEENKVNFLRKNFLKNNLF